MGNAMPFGRYAGVPCDLLVIEDMKYVRWLLAQSWLDAAVAEKLRAAVAELRSETDTNVES